MEVPFTQVSNEPIVDKELSLKALGLYTYIYSKPLNWDFAASRIWLENKDGTDSIKAGLVELEEKWYLVRERQPTGRVNYKLLLKPEVENPPVENPSGGKSPSGKTPSVSNKELIIIKIYKKYRDILSTERKKSTNSAQCKLYIEQLLKEYSEEQLLGSIESYERVKEFTYRVSGQYFFANSKNKNAKHYRIFEDYLWELEEENNKWEKKEKKNV